MRAANVQSGGDRALVCGYGDVGNERALVCGYGDVGKVLRDKLRHMGSQ